MEGIVAYMIQKKIYGILEIKSLGEVRREKGLIGGANQNEGCMGKDCGNSLVCKPITKYNFYITYFVLRISYVLLYFMPPPFPPTICSDISLYTDSSQIPPFL